MFLQEYKEALKRFCKNSHREKIKALFIDVELCQNGIITIFSSVKYNKKTDTVLFNRTEELKNKSIIQQAGIIKKYFDTYGIDYVVMYLSGVFRIFYDVLTQETKDPSNGRVYCGWTINNKYDGLIDTDLAKRINSDNVEEVIIPIC